MLPVIVVTAKNFSSRLPNKNILPLGGKPLTEWSILAAKSIPSSQVVVSTDIPLIKEIALKYNCTVVHQNIDENKSHIDIIKEALIETNNLDKPVILLQPTSPFRVENIISKCWRIFENNQDKTILTTNIVHNAQIIDNSLVMGDTPITVWDGCVAIYPKEKIGDYSKVLTVKNYHINSLQIDTIDDYVQACYSYETFKPVNSSVPQNIIHLLNPIFRSSGLTKHVTLVTRKTEQTIPQNFPVVYVNHCCGYNGGRCDGLFLIANKNLIKAGINDDLRECAIKSKFVVVRDNGELPWLLKNLPEIIGKFYPIRYTISQLDDHLTTGCIATNILTSLGLEVNIIGLYKPETIHKTLDSFHYPAMSREIALFYTAGVLD